jgi:hypothetical protein
LDAVLKKKQRQIKINANLRLISFFENISLIIFEKFNKNKKKFSRKIVTKTIIKFSLKKDNSKKIFKINIILKKNAL